VKTVVLTPNNDSKTVSVLYGDGAGGFLPPQDFPTEISVSAVTAGDLNRDGKLDLIAGYTSGNRIVVLLNNGQNGFSAPSVMTFSPNGYGFVSLKAGDFNGDGNLDVAGMTRTNLYIFLGNGQGGLELNTTLPWNGAQNEIVVGKFNNDNLTDFAVTGGDFGSPWEFGIILGNSSAAFTFNNRYTLPNQPSGIVAGEFNGDGLTDLVVASNYTPQNSTPQTFYLQLWTGNGAGAFTAGAKVNFPFLISRTTAGDFNGDGKSDLAVLAEAGSFIATVIGAGNGTFQNPVYWTPPPTSQIIAADVNQDNRHDLLTIRSGFPKSTVSVLLSVGNNEFSAPKVSLYSDYYLAAADLNNDGLLDLVSTDASDLGYNSEIAVALNDGNKGFLPDRRFGAPTGLKDLAVGDFNGDGKKDVITAHVNGGKPLTVYLGDGTGNVSNPVSTSLNAGFEKIIVGDFNSDGKDDVFATNSQGSSYSLLSSGNGAFTVAPNFPVTIEGGVSKLIKGDFNGDNKLDFAVTRGATTNLWLGSGTGQFTASSNSISNLGAEAAGDFNGDGKLDLAGFTADGLKGVLGDGQGGFGAGFTRTVPGSVRNLISADFNSDGFDDLAYRIEQGNPNLVIVPSGGQNGSWEAPILYSVGGIEGYYSNLLAADFNSDGKPDIGFSNGISRGVIYNTSGTKPCLSINDVTVTEGDSGTATAAFTVTLSAASPEIVRVNYALEGRGASIGTDLQNISGRLEIPAGQTSATVSVNVNNDVTDEFDEDFSVILSSPVNASLTKAAGLGNVIDNDPAPSLTITDVSQNEPDSFQSFNFRVNLSAPSGKPISFLYATADGTAVSGKDYYTATNTVNIQPGTAFADIWVQVTTDSMHEPNETFFLNLSNPTNVTISDDQGKGTIVNNDPVPTLFFFIGGVAEGDTGLTARTINLQLTNPTYQLVTFSLATGDGTALKGKDYNSSDATFVILAEQMSTTTSVQIIGDTINEPNETFNLNLYNVSNATVTNAQAQITIIDDESVANDFDRDGKTDIPVFRPSDRNWYVQFSSTGGFSAFQYGLSTDVPVSGDYNNDGRTDYAVWRASTGGWYTPVPNRSQVWGKEGDVPVPGDYDNDGRIDPAVFRPAAKTWYVQLSSNGSFKIVQFGLETDKPVAADYDGDGKTDIAVFRPATGYWYILRSSDEGITSLQFGIETDQLVPADYDGDGRADIAVFRDGNWYYNRSSNDAFTAFKWGIAGDKPVPGNYDGDDKTDFAVYRSGNWYIWLSSTNSMMTKQFGLPDDVPIPFVSNN
ncbi:MAG TPA: FG-GAP-like repeat-containing protein, partial [Pyrinomonadaceae bacterium]